MTEISIIIPIFNEGLNINYLYKSVLKNIPVKLDYEIIFVDDCSSDNSLELLNKLKNKNKKIKILSFQKNYGQSTALHCGITNATGKYVITMDGDLQNDPIDIKNFYTTIKSSDLDCVIGWRKNRSEKSILRVFVSKIANKLIKKILKTNINDLGCTFKCFKREIFSQIIWATDFHRYFSAFIINEGFKIKEIEVKHNDRMAGESKYGYSRIFNVVVDILFLYFVFNSLNKPLHFFGKFALILLSFSFISSIIAIYLKVFDIRKFTDTPLPELIIFLSLSSLIILFFGILAELILSLYFHLKQKRNYIVKNN